LSEPGTGQEDQGQSADNSGDYQPRWREAIVAGRFIHVRHVTK
jgi:hypothetical protein